MKSVISFALTAVIFVIGGSIGSAEQIELIVTGAQGDGLLPGNIDPATTSDGSGGIGQAGIIYDTDTNLLSIDIEWGSENGYADLTGEVTLLHLHGPTADAAPANFGQVNPQILVNLGNSLQFDSSGSGGGLNDIFFLSNQQEMYLLDGRTYVNVHTSMYPTGEIRGYLVPVAVPEPSASLICAAMLFIAGPRRRSNDAKILL